MKLYSGPLSLFTAKVRIALAEKELLYERIEVGWSLADRYLPHHPDVAALNPKCEVPVLVDGDVVVYDSTLVLEYLEDRTPQPALYPSDLAGRARCRQLEAAADEILFPFVWDFIEESFYPGGDADGKRGGSADGKRDEARLDRARAGLAGYWAEREQDLAGDAYLCGDFSVADIAHFVFLNAATSLGAPLADELSRLRAWSARTAARPAVAREVAETGAFVARLFQG